MSRTGITYQEVMDAALLLEQQGERPTIDKVRQLLGSTGSNTTISKYLQLLRNNSVTKENKVSTPDIVQVAVDRVWQDMRKQTDDEIEKIKEETQKLVEVAENKAERIEADFNGLQARFSGLEDQYRKQSADKEILQLDINALRKEHAILEERHKNLEMRFLEMRTLHTHHLSNLSASHKNEVHRLEESSQLLKESHQKFVDALIKKHEEKRQDEMVTLDNIKVENKKLTDTVSKAQLALQEKIEDVLQLKANLKAAQAENGSILKQMAREQEQWSLFNDKVLISEDFVNQIYGPSKIDFVFKKFSTLLAEKLDQNTLEIKESLNKVFLKLLSDHSKEKHDA
jgi:hypothetical protein